MLNSKKSGVKFTYFERNHEKESILHSANIIDLILALVTDE